MSDEEQAKEYADSKKRDYDPDPEYSHMVAYGAYLAGLRAGRHEEREEIAKMVLEFPGFDPDRGIREQMAAAIRERKGVN